MTILVDGLAVPLAAAMQRSSKRTLLRCWAAGCVGGLALASSVALGHRLPSLGLLPLLAFVPVMLLPISPLSWATAGAAVGASYTAALLLAIWAKSIVLALSVPVVAAASLAIVLGGAAAIAKRLGYSHIGAGAAAAVLWFALTTVLDELGIAFFPLSTGLVLLRPELGLASRVVGIPGLDALVILSSMGVIAMWLGRRRLLPLTLVAWGSFTAIGFYWPVTERGSTTVHVVQPVVDPQHFYASGYSLATRSLIQERLGTLTARAAKSKPGLLLWPEGGSGYPDLQVPSTRATLQRLLKESHSELLVATSLVGEQGRYNGAGLLSGSGLLALTQKANPVPIAEADVTPGRARVLRSSFGVFGALVCYDSLIGKTVRTLVQQGAEFLVLSTDDGSFGHSTATYGHVAATRLRALSMGMPLVVASNFGPSAVIDRTGRERAERAFGERGVLSASFTRTNSQTWPATWLRWLVAGLVMIVCGVALLRKPRSGLKANTSRGGAAAVCLAALAVPCATGLGLGAELGLAWVRDRSSPRQMLSQLSGGRAPRPVEGIGPAFLQSAPETCGSAALAFGLTQLGETSSEELLRLKCRLGLRRASLASLSSCATSAGFSAEGVEASWQWLERLQNAVAILHLSHDHYVTLVRATQDGAWVFDPAAGQLQFVRRMELERVWTGRALRVGYLKPYELDDIVSLRES